MTSSLLVRTLTAVISVSLAYAGNLRPISGIPGAATTGDPLTVGFMISRAEISPAQDAALVVKARVSSVALVHAVGNDWVVTPLAGVQPSPEIMVFSPNGSAAALYYAAGQVQILTGLPANPTVASEINVSGLAVPVTAMAVDDAGSFLLLAGGPAESVSLYRVSIDSASSLLASFRGVSSVRLFNGSQQALVTDTLAATVYQVSGLAGAAVTQVVASPSDGLEGLIGAETDSTGQRVFAAVGTGTVFIFDRSGSPPVTLDCACAPTGLFRLAGGSAFRLTEISDGPLQVLDAGSSPRIVAVPPPSRAVALPEVRR
jgi:hypothetical protein